MTGGEAAYIALMVAIYDRTGSAAWMSVTLMLTIGAMGVLTPFGGVLGDRFDRRRVMIGSDIAAGVAVACLALVHAPAVMLVFALLSAAAQAPFYAASTAAVPNLVEAADLEWANATMAIGRNAGQVLGPVLGGVLVAAVGSSTVFVIQAACFAASAGLVASVRGRFAEAAAPEHRGIRVGFRFLADDRVLRMITLAWVVVLAGVGPVLVAELPLARSFGVGSVGYGMLAGSWGSGAIVGSLLGGRLAGRIERRLLVASAVGMTIGFATVSLAGVFALALAGMAAAGIADGAGGVAEQGILQRRTPDAVRARVLAASEALLLVAFALSFTLAGPVIAVAGVRGAYAVAAVACAGAVGILAIAMRELRAAEVDRDVDGGVAAPGPAGDAEADDAVPEPEQVRAMVG
jgi:MFS family permease